MLVVEDAQVKDSHEVAPSSRRFVSDHCTGQAVGSAYDSLTSAQSPPIAVLNELPSISGSVERDHLQTLTLTSHEDDYAFISPSVRTLHSPRRNLCMTPVSKSSIDYTVADNQWPSQPINLFSKNHSPRPTVGSSFPAAFGEDGITSTVSLPCSHLDTFDTSSVMLKAEPCTPYSAGLRWQIRENGATIPCVQTSEISMLHHPGDQYPENTQVANEDFYSDKGIYPSCPADVLDLSSGNSQFLASRKRSSSGLVWPISQESDFSEMTDVGLSMANACVSPRECTLQDARRKLPHKNIRMMSADPEIFRKVHAAFSSEASTGLERDHVVDNGRAHKKQRISLRLVNSQTLPRDALCSDLSPGSSNLSDLNSARCVKTVSSETVTHCLSPALLSAKSTPPASMTQARDQLIDARSSPYSSCPSKTGNWDTIKMLHSEYSSSPRSESIIPSQEVCIGPEMQEKTTWSELGTKHISISDRGDNEVEEQREGKERTGKALKNKEIVMEGTNLSLQSMEEFSIENDGDKGISATWKKEPREVKKRSGNARAKNPASYRKSTAKPPSKSQYAVGSNQYRKRCKVGTDPARENGQASGQQQKDEPIVQLDSSASPIATPRHVESLERDTRNWGKKHLQPVGFYKDSPETGSSTSTSSDSDDEATVGLAPSATQKWTDEENKLLSSLKEKGMPWSLIASTLGRSERACQLKHNHLFGSHGVAKNGFNHKTRCVKQTRDRRPFFDKNPEKLDLLMSLYTSRKKEFWQDIAREVGCNSTVVETKVLQILSKTSCVESTTCSY